MKIGECLFVEGKWKEDIIAIINYTGDIDS